MRLPLRFGSSVAAAVAAAVAAGALLVMAASSVLAAGPGPTAVPGPTAGPGLTSQITDDTGVLHGEMTRVQAGLDELFRSEALRLWVVLVHTNNGVLARDVARQQFEANEFGPNDMVLVVAVDDHRYGWWELTVAGSDKGQATGMMSAQVDMALSTGLDSSFRAGMYADGIVNLATVLRLSVRAARYPPSSAPATQAPIEYGGYQPVDQPDRSSDEPPWFVFLIGVFGALGIAGTALGGGSGGDSDGGSWSSSGGSSSSGSSWGHGGGGGWSSSGGSGSSGGSSSGGGGGHGGGGGW